MTGALVGGSGGARDGLVALAGAVVLLFLCAASAWTLRIAVRLGRG